MARSKLLDPDTGEQLDALYDPDRRATLYRDPATPTNELAFVLTDRACSLYDADGLSEVEAALKAGSLKVPGLEEMRDPYETCDSLLKAFYPPDAMGRREANRREED